MGKEAIFAYLKGIDYGDIWVQGVIAGLVLGAIGCFFIRKILTRIQEAEVNGIYLQRWKRGDNVAKVPMAFWNARANGEIKLTADDRKGMAKVKMGFQMKILVYAAIIIGMGILAGMWVVGVITEG